MNKILTSFLLFVFLFDSLISFAQKKTNLADRELNLLEKKQLFSGSILVARSGKVIYKRNLGYADIEHKIPINSNTKFEIASITKIFTAILVLQLAEQGKVKLNAPVSDYLPDFIRKDSGEITIHNLLSHTSGIQDFVGLNCDFASWTEKEFMNGLKNTPIRFKPGARFEYASSTYILLRFIIEKVTGKSYEKNLKQNILNPAGMTNTGIIHNQEILDGRALGYVSANGIYQNALPIANHEIFIGASSIYSTITDLVKFDQALYTDTLLKKREKTLMYTVVKPPYGYGWFISDNSASEKIVSHGGDVFGYTSLIERRLKNKIAIIILSNLQGVDRAKIVSILDKTVLR